MRYDLIVHNGMIVTVNPDFDILPSGRILIRDGRIERVDASDSGPLPDASGVVDAGGRIVLPGLVNTHSHLPMTLFRGLADDLPLMEWLQEYIFPAESEYLNPDSIRTGALLGCAEMLLSGTTTCCDGYFYEDAVAEAVLRSGMRGVVAQGVIDFPAPGVPDPKKNVDHAVAFVQAWQNRSPRILPSIFCHAPYTCSPETLKAAKAAAHRLGVLFQIHAAETQHERDRMLAEQGVAPVRYLGDLGILDRRTLLIHAVWVDGADIAEVAERRATVSHNPGSNMKLAAGIAPVPEMIGAGIPVGIGTDGCASNNNLDLFQEMNLAATLHKVHRLDPTAMDARTVLEMATMGGARAIGLDQEIGSVEAGKAADLIILETRRPHLTPIYNPVSHVVYAASGSDVRDVVVDGRLVVKERRLLTVDVEGIMDAASQIGKTIVAGRPRPIPPQTRSS